MKLRTREEKLKHLLSWQESGLSIREYCRQNSLAFSTMRDWRKRYIKETSFWQEGSIKEESVESCSQETVSIKIEISITKELSIKVSYLQ